MQRSYVPAASGISTTLTLFLEVVFFSFLLTVMCSFPGTGPEEFIFGKVQTLSMNVPYSVFETCHG